MSKLSVYFASGDQVWMEDRGYPRRSSNTPHYVVYFGTFTKMLFNALRLGFMVSPERLS